METNPIKEFLKKNRIKQVELADYLGVAKTTICRYVNGTLDLPQRNINSILRNPYGWDISMFPNPSNITISAEASGKGTSVIQLGNENKCETNSTNVNIKSLQKEIEMLRQQLAEEKKRSDEYWKMIQTLMSK